MVEACFFASDLIFVDSQVGVQLEGHGPLIPGSPVKVKHDFLHEYMDPGYVEKELITSTNGHPIYNDILHTQSYTIYTI